MNKLTFKVWVLVLSVGASSLFFNTLDACNFCKKLNLEQTNQDQIIAKIRSMRFEPVCNAIVNAALYRGLYEVVEILTNPEMRNSDPETTCHANTTGDFYPSSSSSSNSFPQRQSLYCEIILDGLNRYPKHLRDIMIVNDILDNPSLNNEVPCEISFEITCENKLNNVLDILIGRLPENPTPVITSTTTSTQSSFSQGLGLFPEWPAASIKFEVKSLPESRSLELSINEEFYYNILSKDDISIGDLKKFILQQITSHKFYPEGVCEECLRHNNQKTHIVTGSGLIVDGKCVFSKIFGEELKRSPIPGMMKMKTDKTPEARNQYEKRIGLIVPNLSQSSKFYGFEHGMFNVLFEPCSCIKTNHKHVEFNIPGQGNSPADKKKLIEIWKKFFNLVPKSCTYVSPDNTIFLYKNDEIIAEYPLLLKCYPSRILKIEAEISSIEDFFNKTGTILLVPQEKVQGATRLHLGDGHQPPDNSNRTPSLINHGKGWGHDIEPMDCLSKCLSDLYGYTNQHSHDYAFCVDVDITRRPDLCACWGAQSLKDLGIFRKGQFKEICSDPNEMPIILGSGSRERDLRIIHDDIEFLLADNGVIISGSETLKKQAALEEISSKLSSQK